MKEGQMANGKWLMANVGAHCVRPARQKAKGSKLEQPRGTGPERIPLDSALQDPNRHPARLALWALILCCLATVAVTAGKPNKIYADDRYAYIAMGILVMTCNPIFAPIVLPRVSIWVKAVLCALCAFSAYYFFWRSTEPWLFRVSDLPLAGQLHYGGPDTTGLWLAPLVYGLTCFIALAWTKGGAEQ